MRTVRLPTWYYEQGDADYSLDVPAEAFGGWQQAELPLSLEHTAVVCMHACLAGDARWKSYRGFLELTYPEILAAGGDRQIFF